MPGGLAAGLFAAGAPATALLLVVTIPDGSVFLSAWLAGAVVSAVAGWLTGDGSRSTGGVLGGVSALGTFKDVVLCTGCLRRNRHNATPAAAISSPNIHSQRALSTRAASGGLSSAGSGAASGAVARAGVATASGAASTLPGSSAATGISVLSASRVCGSGARCSGAGRAAVVGRGAAVVRAAGVGAALGAGAGLSTPVGTVTGAGREDGVGKGSGAITGPGVGAGVGTGSSRNWIDGSGACCAATGVSGYRISASGRMAPGPRRTCFRE